MPKIAALLLLLALPMFTQAQGDTVRLAPGGTGADLFSDRTIFGFQRAPLYGHDWPVMQRLPAQGWAARANETLCFPASGQAIALRFFVKNEAPAPCELVLEIDDLQLDRAKIWVEKPSGHIDSSQMSGDKTPFAGRDIPFANPNFIIRLAPLETAAVLIYLDQSGLYLAPRLRLWALEPFAAYAARRQLAAGLILGAFGLSLLAFSLLAAFGVSAAAKWYAAFLCLQTLQMANILGIGHQFFWPKSGLLSTLLNILLPMLGFLVLFQMMSVFLRLRARLPRWHKWLGIAVRAMSAYIAIGYLLSAAGFERAAALVYPVGMFLGTALLGLAMTCCLRVWLIFRESQTLLFLIAFAFGLVGVAISWLAKLGIGLPFFLARYSTVAGFSLDLLVFNFLIARDLWQTKTQNQALQLSLAEADRAAAANLLRGEETERQRLSMALHDGIGIELGSIQRRLERLFGQREKQAPAEAEQVVADLANVAQQIRQFSHALDPFSAKNLSLPDLLDNLLFDFENNCPRTAVEFSQTNLPAAPSEPISEREKHLFFIAAELFNNVARHAQASRVWLRLEYLPGKITLEIADDGVGYDPALAPSGVGMSHIRARAQLTGAAFSAARRAGGGMAHRVEMPLAAQLDRAATFEPTVAIKRALTDAYDQNLDLR